MIDFTECMQSDVPVNALLLPPVVPAIAHINCHLQLSVFVCVCVRNMEYWELAINFLDENPHGNDKRRTSQQGTLAEI